MLMIGVSLRHWCQVKAMKIQALMVPHPTRMQNVIEKSELQLRQHLNALLYLFNAAEAKRPLSEELIKRAHHILMDNLSILKTR